MKYCLHCKVNTIGSRSKYCSNRCQKDQEYEVYIAQWFKGNQTGIRGKNALNFSGHVIRYITNKYNHKCALCLWGEVNAVTGKSPLEIDHIDGDSNNCSEDNLILLCPNCHSLTTTYKNLNKGNGRGWRREKYVRIV